MNGEHFYCSKCNKRVEEIYPYHLCSECFMALDPVVIWAWRED